MSDLLLWRLSNLLAETTIRASSSAPIESDSTGLRLRSTDLRPLYAPFVSASGLLRGGLLLTTALTGQLSSSSSEQLQLSSLSLSAFAEELCVTLRLRLSSPDSSECFIGLISDLRCRNLLVWFSNSSLSCCCGLNSCCLKLSPLLSVPSSRPLPASSFPRGCENDRPLFTVAGVFMKEWKWFLNSHFESWLGGGSSRFFRFRSLAGLRLT